MPTLCEVNVLLALSYDRHVHHEAALNWLDQQLRNSFGQLIAQFQQQWQWDSLCVADAALYSAETLQQLKTIA